MIFYKTKLVSALETIRLALTTFCRLPKSAVLLKWNVLALWMRSATTTDLIVSAKKDLWPQVTRAFPKRRHTLVYFHLFSFLTSC